MNSSIDQIIEEIEDYIESCKFQPLSSTKIIVNKDEIQELIADLRHKTPEEVKRYQKMISNKEAILSDARAKAEALINDATMHTNELINEHEIMQQAYSQANDVVKMATQQAQEILDNATIEANNMRMAAMQYTDDILANVENLISQAMRTTTDHYESFFGALNHYSDVVNANRIELNPPEADEYSGIAEDTPKEVSTDTGSINLDLIK